jgi:hypothetical protein
VSPGEIEDQLAAFSSVLRVQSLYIDEIGGHISGRWLSSDVARIYGER